MKLNHSTSKKTIVRKAIFNLIIVLGFTFTSTLAFAGGPPPPPPPGGGGAGDVPVEGGAPIGGGSFILLGLAAAYGGKKAYNYFTGMDVEPLEE